jgi:hypothetical protein
MGESEQDRPAEVQTAQQIRELDLDLLERELHRPAEPLAIGGPMCSWYAIENPIAILRTTEVEALLAAYNRHDGSLTYSPDEIRNAAIAVFGVVEERLRPFRLADAPVHAHTYPWRLQAMAKNALADIEATNVAVRAIQDDATGGRPLTICVGRFHRHALEAPLGIKGVPAKELRARAIEAIRAGKLRRLPGISRSGGDGCARTHYESAEGEHLFKRYCDNCSKRAGNLQRALERNFWAIKDGRSGGRGTDSCSACGESFDSTRPNQKRCPEHRRSR